MRLFVKIVSDGESISDGEDEADNDLTADALDEDKSDDERIPEPATPPDKNGHIKIPKVR